jgi:hypothetical protein
MKIDGMTNNDLQNITHQAKDRVNINPNKNMRVNSGGSKGYVVPASLVAPNISKERRYRITGATTVECY